MKVLLGVCGSIAAYKTFDLARLLVNNGHVVKVVLSRGAEEFVRPMVYKYLGVKEVYSASSDFIYPENKNDVGTVLHIELAKWADKFIVAPLSANTISKFAHGRSDDLLSSIFLAIEQTKPILLFPAMNTNMLTHPFVKENLERLEKIKTLPQVYVSSTMTGELACGDVGAGKLPSIESIQDLIETFSFNANSKKVVITTGATISSVDPVRYLTNASTGKTGYELAKDFLSAGFSVSMIAGKNATSLLDQLDNHPRFNMKRVVSTRDMLKVAKQETIDATAYISAAAISDIEFVQEDGKLKKSKMQDSLPILMAPDVLQTILNERSDDLKVIGFAAETDLTKEILLEKWNRKKVDLLVGTHVSSGLSTNSNETHGFSNDSAHYSLMKDGDIIHTGELSKSDLAKIILEEVQ
ncbi:hypothetical protein A9Q84_04055 [Halobacteriovorax marinus]|uniref:Coenzyme A biosynthesis bifunctional protein CoaBC n=1 Tax=Halobacteriovorax marinus TaxID=97084 RepID=A0A1Y5FAG0_9BACT|nr:hypothetical protein A9Q84_04055 [Halobacteriovorax marinus]